MLPLKSSLGLDSYRDDFLLFPFGERPDYSFKPFKRMVWNPQPTRKDIKRTLSYLNDAERAVSEREISKATGLYLWFWYATIDPLLDKGYIRQVKSPAQPTTEIATFRGKNDVALKIGTALMHSAEGNYYEITERGRRHLRYLSKKKRKV